MDSQQQSIKPKAKPSASLPLRLENRYRLVEWLGAGRQGVAYRAFDEIHDQDVVIKFLSPQQLIDAEASKHFVQRAGAATQLLHPHIVALYDVGQTEQWHYVVQEYVLGQDIGTKFAGQEQAVTSNDAISYMKAVFEALAYADSQHIIHGNIRPRNIIITLEGYAKIADFGLPMAHDHVALINDNVDLGLVSYLSPEVLAENPATHQTDLYAVGAVFYELMTGQPLFRGADFAAKRWNILNTPLTAPRALDTTISDSLEEILIRLLAKDLTTRYESASAVLAMCEELLQPVAVSDLPESNLAPSSPREGTATDSSTIKPGEDAPLDDIDMASPQLSEALTTYAALADAASAVEAERQRLATLLQDGLTERLSLLLAQANTYEQTLSVNPPVQMAFSVIVSLIQQVIQEARDLSDNLHPTTLLTLGLAPALEGLAMQLQRTHALNIALNIERLQERLPTQIELALFRTAQEGFQRAVLDAQASYVTLDLFREDEILQFNLTDNGLSFSGVEGLQAAQQRIEQLGGHVDIVQQTQGGLAFKIRLPLAPPIALTPRETDVIRLIAEGLSNKEIAKRLSITPRTVNFHLDNLYSKLGVNSRTEAAIYALRQGWGPKPV